MDGDECPISWDTDIKDIIEKKRADPVKYTWLMDNIGQCIVGVEVWKNNVRTGNKLISEVMTESSEAAALILMVNYWSSWGDKAKLPATVNVTTNNDDASSIDTSANSATSTNSATSMTLYTKSGKGSTKDGWSDEGLEYYDQLKKEVREDRSSAQGKEFEINFKAAMKEQAGAPKKRKRGGYCMVFLENDLSDDSDDEDEPQQNSRQIEKV